MLKKNLNLLVLILFIALAQLSLLQPSMVWLRQAILAGQWWRIITANFTHTNLNHALLNIAALVLIFAIYPQYLANRIRLMLLILWLSLAIGIGLFVTEINWYAGFSGVLHGMLLYCALRDIGRKHVFGWLVLLGLIGKVSYEWLQQSDGAISSLIEANIAYQAHFLGMAAAVLFFFIESLLKVKRQR